MKNKSKLRLTLIIIGIVFTLSTISNFNIINDHGENDRTTEIRDERNFKSLKSSGYWNLDFIHVDYNWTFTSIDYDWCSGDGSWGNPFLIENVTINAQDSVSPIVIENSNAYFIIRNCTLYNASSFPYTGILLNNTSNGTVINNYCHDLYAGIHLENSDNNTVSGNIASDNYVGIYCGYFSHNNTISGNNISNNSYGMLSTLSHNNTISGNTANNNHNFGIDLHLCENNTISGNTANNNSLGFTIEMCHYSKILGNTANNNTNDGFLLSSGNNYTVSGNTANYNKRDGIYLSGCNKFPLAYHFHSSVSGNTANYNSRDGIRLINSNDLVVSGNNANYNSRDGIYLWGFNYDDNADNIVSGNTLSYNTVYGIELSLEGHDNTIFLNNFINNGQNALDDVGYINRKNRWDNGEIGNSWDDYIGVDLNDDGIGDSPYLINGSAGSIDRYPIFDDGQDDFTPPIIAIIEPSDGEVFGVSPPPYVVNITEPILDTVWYTMDGGVHNITITVFTGSLDENIWNTLSDGQVTIIFYANDTNGNIGTNSVIIIKDTIEEFPLTLVIIVISSIAGIGVAGVSMALLRKRKRMSKVI